MPTTILFFKISLQLLLSQQNTENEQKTKKTNHRLTRISKQVTFDLVDRYFLSKKQRKSFNAPLYVLKKNLNSNDNSHTRKRLTAALVLCSQVKMFLLLS